MTITRAKVLDDDEPVVFSTDEAYVERRDQENRIYGRNPDLPDLAFTPKMWANSIGLHVQDQDEEDHWTVYPLVRVLWMEEVR